MKGEDEEELIYGLYEQQCREIEKEYLFNLEFVEVGWKVYDGDYGSPIVDCCGRFGGPYKVDLKKPLPHLFSRDYRKLCFSIVNLVRDLGICWISDVDIYGCGGMIFVSVYLDEADGTISGFREFAEYVAKVVEPKKKEFWDGILEILLKLGYLNNSCSVRKEADKGFKKAGTLIGKQTAFGLRSKWRKDIEVSVWWYYIIFLLALFLVIMSVLIWI